MSSTALPDRPFTSAALPELGITRRRLRSELAAGTVRRLFRGVYASAELPETVELRAAALALVVADGHVIVDRTAAWLHGIDAYSTAELELGPLIETCSLRGDHRTQRPGVRGRTRDLAESDIAVVSGLRVTTPLRTALDLGCHLRRREAYAALCGLAREHGITAADLGSAIPRFKRRRGVIQLRELAALVDPRLESPREAWTLLAILDAGLPPPEPQVWIEIDGVPTYRLDLGYRRLRIAIEYDGVEAHERTAEQREHDGVRRRWLHDHGWTVIVVRVGDFTGDRLDVWLGQLREVLRSAYSTRRW